MWQDLQQQMREEYHRLRAAGLSEDAAAHCPDSVKVCGALPRKWWCVQCDTFRPKRAHHCKTCRACVLEMDHHCPWVNNCVGRRNHKFFILFVGYAWLACIWSVAILTHALLQINEETAWNPQFLGPANGRFTLRSCVAAQFLCLAGAALSFVFAIFASVMGCDQWTFLYEGHGVVDQKLHKMGARHSLGNNQRSVSSQLAEVLGAGEGLSCWWFLPFAEPPFAIFKAGVVNWHAREELPKAAVQEAKAEDRSYAVQCKSCRKIYLLRPTWMGYGSDGAWEKLPEEWGTYAARAAELFRLKDGAWLNRAEITWSTALQLLKTMKLAMNCEVPCILDPIAGTGLHGVLLKHLGAEARYSLVCARRWLAVITSNTEYLIILPSEDGHQQKGSASRAAAAAATAAANAAVAAGSAVVWAELEHLDVFDDGQVVNAWWARHGEASNSILMLSFPPPPPSEVAEAALRRFQGKWLLFLGEWRGCTGSSGFFNLLEAPCAGWTVLETFEVQPDLLSAPSSEFVGSGAVAGNLRAESLDRDLTNSSCIVSFLQTQPLLRKKTGLEECHAFMPTATLRVSCGKGRGEAAKISRMITIDMAFCHNLFFCPLSFLVPVQEIASLTKFQFDNLLRKDARTVEVPMFFRSLGGGHQQPLEQAIRLQSVYLHCKS
eukprot:s251_g27.t1